MVWGDLRQRGVGENMGSCMFCIFGSCGVWVNVSPKSSLAPGCRRGLRQYFSPKPYMSRIFFVFLTGKTYFMRTLPTVTLEMGDANGSIVWKAFYPYADQAIKAKLEQFGLSYESSLRLSVLPYSTELPETIRTSLVNMAYVVVKGANHATSPFEKTPVQSLAPAKPSVTAGALLHHGEHRIKVAMTYDESCVKQLRSIEDARWSRTHRCWHLPRTKEAWAALNKLFTVTVEANAATETEKKGPDQPPTAPSQGGQQAPQPEYPTSKITIVHHWPAAAQGDGPRPPRHREKHTRSPLESRSLAMGTAQYPPHHALFG
jgi:hypothetical protein